MTLIELEFLRAIDVHELVVFTWDPNIPGAYIVWSVYTVTCLLYSGYMNNHVHRVLLVYYRIEKKNERQKEENYDK